MSGGSSSSEMKSFHPHIKWEWRADGLFYFPLLLSQPASWQVRFIREVAACPTNPGLPPLSTLKLQNSSVFTDAGKHREIPDERQQGWAMGSGKCLSADGHQNTKNKNEFKKDREREDLSFLCKHTSWWKLLEYDIRADAMFLSQLTKDGLLDRSTSHRPRGPKGQRPHGCFSKIQKMTLTHLHLIIHQ